MLESWEQPVQGGRQITSLLVEVLWRKSPRKRGSSNKLVQRVWPVHYPLLQSAETRITTLQADPLYNCSTASVSWRCFVSTAVNMVPCPQAHGRWNGAEAAGTPFAIRGVALLRLTHTLARCTFLERYKQLTCTGAPATCPCPHGLRISLPCPANSSLSAVPPSSGRIDVWTIICSK